VDQASHSIRATRPCGSSIGASIGVTLPLMRVSDCDTSCAAVRFTEPAG
jgi:hypothetical protein